MTHKSRSVLTILILLAALHPLYGQSFLLQKDTLVPAGEVEDNVISFGGDIVVDGYVRENIIAFGGTITINGEVGEVVLGFGSEIRLTSSATIQGDVVSVGGTLKKDPGCTISGDTILIEIESSHDLARIFSPGGIRSFLPFLMVLKFITLLIWLLLAVVLVAVFPSHITRASHQVKTSFWSVFGTGLLGLIIFVGLSIFSAFLSLIIIGIPILVSLIFIGIIVKIFGRVVLFCFLGEALARAFGKKDPTLYLSAGLGFVLVGFLGFIPILGPLFSLVLNIVGWGAVIRTKFGSTTDWSTKRGAGVSVE